ncbi:MAG: Trm112 family protein [Candidatus Saccharibacteria bacterium]|nr:Trm112 family protein [Candidatus Saccharibacteria bacterium]
MKIIEKKCPNCHANLEFDVGEQNVKCPSCRRAFAIEYDKDFVDPEVQLKAKDIQLKMLDDITKVRSFHKAFFIPILVFAAVIIGVTVFLAISGYRDYKSTKDEIETSRQRAIEEESEFKAQQKAAEEEFKARQKASEEEQKKTQEEVEKMLK